MNKPVSLELKQLLYNKGWRYELSDDISETSSLYNNHSLAEERFNQNDVNYVDVTIADVTMWLFNEHGIWIFVKPLMWNYDENIIRYNYTVCKFVKHDYIDTEISSYDYNTPTEAYIEAIKYCLNNKIN